MKKRNQLISSLIALAITTSITTTCAYAKDEETNSTINTNNCTDSSTENSLKLNQVKVTTGAAAFVDEIENNKIDETDEKNEEEFITIENSERTLDQYLKSKIHQNNRRVKRYTSFSLFESNKEEIKDRIKSGIENYETDINIKDLVNLDDIKNNSNKILDLYFDVMYENPQFFYCSPTSVNLGKCTYNQSSGQLNSCDIKITYEYSNDVIAKMRNELNNKIKDIKQKYLNNCSTNLEIEYAIHDYITQNCTYDKDNYDKKTVPNISHTSYGALVNQIAVCDGYSKATMLLLNEYGIEAGIVTNDSHAWNYVNIDGNYYQTDLTWDDPTPETNKIMYKNFNCSDSVMHKIHPWTSTLPGNCTDTTFDNLFRTVNGSSVSEKSAVRIKDKLYYLDKTDLWKCDLNGNNKTLVKQNITENTNMLNLTAHNKDIYYLSELEIKKININNGQIETFKNLSDEFNFTSGSYSVQFYIKDNKLNVKFGQSQTGSNLRYSTKKYELSSTEDTNTDVETNNSDGKSQDVIKLNKSNLQALYNDNKDKLKGNYTDETWNLFINSLNQAKDILDRDDITQPDVNNALSNLQTAISNLKEETHDVIKPNKSNLQALYSNNKYKLKDNYTDETWNLFINSLNQAKDILDRDDITQSDIDNALANLQTAISNLKEKSHDVIKLNKSTLQALYSNNKYKLKGNYTDETWNLFLNSLNQAKDILDRDDITQPDVDNALANLQTALNNLKEKVHDVIKLNKSNLQALYSNNKYKLKGNYTDETWNLFINSLNQAKYILDRDNVTQLDVNNALANLQTAINNLKEKAHDVIKPNKSNLQALYSNNKYKLKSNYTDETWNLFLNSLNQAKDILDRDDITQSDVDNALANLQTAINNLKEKAPEVINPVKPNNNTSSGGNSRGGGSSGGGSSSRDSSENKLDANTQNDTYNSTKININDSSNLKIVNTVKNVAKTLIEINNISNINKEVSLDEIYQVNSEGLKGTIADLKSDNNKFIYITCEDTTNAAKTASLKIDTSKLNSKDKYLYKLDTITNKLVLINNTQENSVEIQLKNQDKYILSNTEMQSLKNNNWNKINNNWLYVENGQAITGWIKTSDNKWYHMNNQGIMQKGWIQDNNKWYHLSNSGHMDTGWFNDANGNWYYLNTDGSMKTGWFNDYYGNWYYLNPNGSLAVNTRVNGYYIDENGLWN
ncbi:hypothetical protein UT300005_04400 [Clostridium sp. CTA-5]